MHEDRLIANRQARNGRRHQIAMPETLEAGLRMRLTTVAGGSAIANDVKQSSGECAHQWERTYAEDDGEWEVCGICDYRLKFVNSCSKCRTKICNRCRNNRL